jgi:hypothetical protein
LLPGFGAPGIELIDNTHAVAPFISAFSQRLAYRATIDESAPEFEQYAQIFARNRAGAAVAAELRIDRGRIVFVPPLLDPQAERGQVARELSECFERFQAIGEAS